jgi:hypothetical protein
MFENQSGTNLCEHLVYGAFNLTEVLQKAAAECSITKCGSKVLVTLPNLACRLALDVGGRRQYAHSKSQLNPSTWIYLRRHIIGAFGELGFALAHGLYWDGQKGSDVGPYEIRTTVPDVGDPAYLRINKKDTDEKPFILAVVPPSTEATKVEYVGWSFAAEAKKKEFWGPPPWDRDKKYQNWIAHWVHQNDLHPMSELPKPYSFCRS